MGRQTKKQQLKPYNKLSATSFLQLLLFGFGN